MTTEKKFPKSPNQIQSPDIIRTDILEPMDYQYQSRGNIEVEITQPEFTSLCPMTGLPDYGAITIRYRPNKSIIELKSLKYYLLQYRNVGIFYEHAVNKILADIHQVILPARIEVSGKFTARGGITTNVVVVNNETQSS